MGGYGRAVLLATTLAVLIAPGRAIPLQERQQYQDLAAYLNSIQSGEEMQGVDPNKLRELATLYETILKRGEELEEGSPLQARLMEILQQDFKTDKRASYMSLCHFKICNMGRKRTSNWHLWHRN